MRKFVGSKWNNKNPHYVTREPSIIEENGRSFQVSQKMAGIKPVGINPNPHKLKNWQTTSQTNRDFDVFLLPKECTDKQSDIYKPEDTPCFENKNTCGVKHQQKNRESLRHFCVHCVLILILIFKFFVWLLSLESITNDFY